MGVKYYLPKYEVNPFSARLKDKMPFMPHEVMKGIRPNLVCHSAGGLMAKRLMDSGQEFGTIFLFGSAMDRDTEFDSSKYDKIYNIYCRKDKALLLGAWMLLHPFGGMGRAGYKGKSPNVINVEASFKKTEIFQHSNYFLDENIQEWVNFCLDKA